MSILKQTDDYICLTVKKFNNMPLRAIKQKHLPNISLLVINKRLKSHISMLNIDTGVFNLPKSSWKGPCLFGVQYILLMSHFSIAQLPKNLKERYVDLGSPSPIQRGTLNSSTQPSCLYGAVSRTGNESMDSAVFVNTLKEAFQINTDHRRWKGVTILKDNTPCHVRREAGYNFLKNTQICFSFIF